MKKNNKIFKKSLSLFSLFSIGVIPIATSCSTYNNFYIEPEQTPSKEFEDDSTSSGHLSEEILNSSILNLENYTSHFSNVNQLPQNAANFVDFGNFDSYKGDSSKIEQDIFLHFYILWLKNKNFSFEKQKISNIVIKNNNTKEIVNNNFILNKTSISFEASVNIKPTTDSYFILDDKQFFLKKDLEYPLTIKVENQLLKPSINLYLNKYYLGWCVDKATINFNGSIIDDKKFIPTKQFFSHSLPYYFLNLTNNFTYFDLWEKNKDLNIQIKNEDVEQKIDDQIQNNINIFFNYIDTSVDLINLLSEDIPINLFLQKISYQLINFLVNEKIIPDYLKNFLIEALYGTSNGNEIQTIPFIEVFDENRNAILKLIESFVGSLIDIISPYIDKIKPGIKVDSEEYNEIKNLISSLPENIQNIILNDILGIGGKPKSLFNILFDNYKVIFNLINPSSNNPTIKAVETILDIVLQKDNSTNSYKSIYDSIFANDTNKKNFMDAIIGLIPPTVTGVGEYLNILITNNQNFNKQNLLNFINSIAAFMNGFFERNSEYTSFLDKYKNLTFQIKKNKKINIDLNNETLDFDYEVCFKLNKKVELNLETFKNLISKSAFYELLKKLVPSISNYVTILQSTSIDTYVKNFLPNKLVYGSTDNLTSIKFVANNQKYNFTPIQKSDGFYSGINFAYDIQIYNDDPGFIENITKYSGYNMDFNQGTILFFVNVDFYYSSFWKSLLQNVFTRSYTFSKTMNVDFEDKLANLDEYNTNQYLQGFDFDSNLNNISNQQIAGYFPITSNNFKVIESNINEKVRFYEWADGKIESIAVNGLEPIATNEIVQTLYKELFTFNNVNISNIYPNFNLNIDFDINPIFNMEIPFKISSSVISINYKVKVFLAQMNLNLPFKFLDNPSKQLVNYFSKTISYFSLEEIKQTKQ